MWKWKEPVKLKSLKPLPMHSNTLYSKIPANYQFMYCRMDAEELLHVFSLPPEFMVNQNNLFYNTQLQIEFINQFMNRICLEGNQYISYQDRAFITTLLNRIGITNQQGFIRQLHLLFNERNLLTKLSNIPQKKIQKQSLESKLYKRIHHTENVQKLCAFLQHTQIVKNSVSLQEALILEQQRQIDNRFLLELKEKFLNAEENISLLECGMYTLQTKEKESISEKDIVTNLSATILLNLADMAKCILSKKESNSFIEFKEIICSSTKLYAEIFFTKTKTHKFSDYKVLKQLHQTKEILDDVEKMNVQENLLEYSIMEKDNKKIWETKEYLDLIDQKNKEIYKKLEQQIQRSEESITVKADKKEIRKQALRAIENQEEVLQEALMKTNTLQIMDNQKEIEKYLSFTDETKKVFYHNLLDALNVENIFPKSVFEKTEQFQELFLYKENNNSRETEKIVNKQNKEEFDEKKIEELKQKTLLENTESNYIEKENIDQYQELLLYKDTEKTYRTEITELEQNSILEKYDYNRNSFIHKKIEEIAQKTAAEKSVSKYEDQEYIEELEGLVLYKENHNIRETEETILEQNNDLEIHEQNKEKFIEKKIAEIVQKTVTEKTEAKYAEQEHLEELEELVLYKENHNIRETEETILEQNNVIDKQESYKEEIIQKKIEEIVNMAHRTASVNAGLKYADDKHFENAKKNMICEEAKIYSVELVHKLVQNSYDQEEMKKIPDEQITHKNKITQSSSIVQNERFITEVVAGSIQTQIGQLSDQVYHRIEKRLQNERKRRGL